jgi:membrane-associated phospholipid phosphatase
MTIAIAVLILGYRTGDRKTIIFWRIFLGFALIMDVSRITMGVHWPLDIIWGSIIGAIVAFIITLPIIHTTLSERIYNPIINFQEYLFGKIQNLSK